jgi:hypothetical protein
MAPGLTQPEFIILKQLAENELKNFSRMQVELKARLEQEPVQVQYIMAKANIALMERLIEKLDILILAL